MRTAVRRGGADDSGLEVGAADFRAVTAAAGGEEVHPVAFPMMETESPDAVMGLAREGTIRALRSARDAAARRVVLTSSLVAVGYIQKSSQTEFTEADWTDSDTRGLLRHPLSKVIPEQAAWDFVQREGDETALVTGNPTLILSPTLTTRAVLLTVGQGGPRRSHASGAAPPLRRRPCPHPGDGHLPSGRQALPAPRRGTDH